jgi:predicted TIM-barrel fold metal-dependent hydrolase
MDIIDTHLHLVLRKQFGYGWTDRIPVLHGDFTLADYKRLLEPGVKAASIFMETAVDDADYQAEARYVATLVGRDGILAQIPSCRPESHDGFDAWLDEAAGLSVVGFRRVLHVVPDDVSVSETFRTNVRKIGKRGWTFDMCFLGRQMPLAVELSRLCDQPLMLDHCGLPDIAAGAFEPWATNITALAALPHVHVKMSGITPYGKPEQLNEAGLRPWVHHVIQQFGTKRVIWGGDWPVTDMGTGLPRWIEISRQLLSGFSAGERADIFVNNALRFYRLPAGSVAAAGR